MHQILLTDYLDRAASLWGECVAIEMEQETIDYATLCRNSKQLAFKLCTLLQDIRQPIAIYLPKGILCVTGMMATLYSGNVYAPMDVRAPVHYLEKTLQTLGCKWILTDAVGAKKLEKADLTANIIRIDLPDEMVDGTQTPLALNQLTDCDTAFVLFTSGSTGDPKGVAIPHRRIIDYIEWARDYFSCDHSTIIGNQAPFLFTVSTFDIYMCLAAGAKLCLIPESTLAHPEKLMYYLNEKNINLIFWVPSIYKNVAASTCFTANRPQHLTTCLFVGEPMPVEIVNQWMQVLPKTRFFHLYGTTETDMVLCYPIVQNPFPGESLPLGTARRNASVFLLDDQNRPTFMGEIGEICISGSALASGYWGMRDKTQEAFTCAPDGLNRMYRTGDLGEWSQDGTIIFHGRCDHQFKHLGYRLEAVGIERIATASGIVQDACVVYHTERQQIVLFYCSKTEDARRKLQKYLLGAMPAYMLPTKLIELDTMPMTNNGKKDRVTLQGMAKGMEI